MQENKYLLLNALSTLCNNVVAEYKTCWFWLLGEVSLAIPTLFYYFQPYVLTCSSLGEPEGCVPSTSRKYYLCFSLPHEAATDLPATAWSSSRRAALGVLGSRRLLSLFGASCTSIRGSKIFFFLVEKEGLYENFNSENGSERRRCKLACSPTSHEEATLIWGHEQSACFFEQRTIPQGMVGFLGGFSTYSPGFFPYLPPAIRGHVEHLFFTESSCGLKNPLQQIVSRFLF